MCIYIYIYTHPVSLKRYPSFRTEPLEHLTPLPMNKWVPEKPSPWRTSSKRKSCYGDRVYVHLYVYTYELPPKESELPTRPPSRASDEGRLHSCYTTV